jgi:hypothetical protein
MRIGIIAVGRSGGYNLGQWISLELGYPYKHEPFLNGLNIDGKDIVVKVLSNEWKTGKETNVWRGRGSKEYPKPQMDKWIGLIRENVRECAISHLRGERTGIWRKPYKVSNEWLIENENEIQTIQKDIEYINNEIKTDIDIQLQVSYEGIYNSGEDIKRLIEFLDIKSPKYLHLFDNSLRLRDTENKPKRKQLI